MKKKILCLISLLLVAAMCFSACGSGKSSGADTSTGPTASFSHSKEDSARPDGYGFDSGLQEAAQETADISGDGSSGESSQTVMPQGGTNRENVKLIYKAFMTLQTDAYDDTAKELVALVDSMGGYTENVEVYNGSYYYGRSGKHGDYVFRVPSNRYEEFVGTLGDQFHVTQIRQEVDDIGLEYFEVESRLENLKIKQKRLQDLLSEADNMADILTIESSLSDVEYQINMYGSAKNRYDSLINYSTVNISLEEVIVYDPTIQDDPGFFEKLSEEFRTGASAFLDGLESFAYWLSYNIFDIIVIVAVVFFFCKFIGFLRRRKKGDRRERRGRRKAAAAEEISAGDGPEMTGSAEENTEEKKE